MHWRMDSGGTEQEDSHEKERYERVVYFVGIGADFDADPRPHASAATIGKSQEA